MWPFSLPGNQRRHWRTSYGWQGLEVDRKWFSTSTIDPRFVNIKSVIIIKELNDDEEEDDDYDDDGDDDDDDGGEVF